MRSLYQFTIIYFRKVNWMLLLFLILCLNVKIAIKIIALVIFLLLNRKHFNWKHTVRQKFIWFYFGLIIIAIINLLFQISSAPPNYFITVAVGILFWLMCITAAILNVQFVLNTDITRLHNSITLFFILNAFVTIGQLLLIIWDAGTINPFLYQGMHQKYFVGTGDMIKGISFDVSTTNAILNAFGVFYFLYRNKMHFALLCMSILLLTASNVTNILLALTLMFSFVFQSNRNQKSIILACFFLLAIFVIKISPQNNTYITDAYKKIFHKQSRDQSTLINDTLFLKQPDSLLTSNDRKRKEAIVYLDSVHKELLVSNSQKGHLISSIKKPFIPKPSIHTEPFQRKREKTLHQKLLLEFAIKNIPDFDTTTKLVKSRKLPGKLIAINQTINFFKTHPLKILFGNGIGNFSSKLAFRTTGLQITGNYPEKFLYINKDFLNNHLNVYLSYFSKDAELHSIVNSPNNTYDQLISEYGLAGMFCFIGFYIVFFINNIKKLTYGIPILLLFIGILNIEYWFEQLSIVILFELLMLINIKETAK